MPKIQYVKKKIQNSYFIWLQKSNKYILLEEPAWFVFSKIVKSYKVSTIASECAIRYGMTPEESLTFVNDIGSGIEQMNQPAYIAENAGEYPVELKSFLFKPYSVHHYYFGDNLIEFSYETELFESYLHPLICHLETKEIKDKAPLFELFGYDDRIVFRLNGEVEGVWKSHETHLVKGLIFMNLVNRMFDKSDDFWLMTVHASAISNGRKTILIPAVPGSGKTTMAAMLQDLGYQLVSDDFVPIDRYSFLAWPFPIAMSVKHGSMNLLSSIYPDLKQKPITHISPEKSVRYIFPENNQAFSNKAFPVKEFIFIKYDQSVDFKWEVLDTVTATKLLLDQSWISPTEGNANILLERLCQWSYHQLTYSDNQKALNAITNLFEND